MAGQYSTNDWREYQELYHYGIKGQKWGVRRYQNSDGSLTDEGRKHYGYSTSRVRERGSIEDDTAAAFAFIAAYDAIVIGTAIGSAVAEKVKDRKARQFSEQCEKERALAKTDEKTGLKLQATRKSREEDLKRVNPDYRLNPDGARSNCTNCTMAYEMRRRGYEVNAKLKSDGRNGTDFGERIFKGAVTKNVREIPKDEDEALRFFNKYKNIAMRGKNKELAKETIAALKKEEPGSRGQLCVTWGPYGGHSMAYEIGHDGKVRIMDGQDAKIYNEKEAEKLLRYTVASRFQRLDNLDFDAKKVKEAVR